MFSISNFSRMCRTVYGKHGEVHFYLLLTTFYCELMWLKIGTALQSLVIIFRAEFQQYL
jgi:hypothetical protein